MRAAYVRNRADEAWLMSVNVDATTAIQRADLLSRSVVYRLRRKDGRNVYPVDTMARIRGAPFTAKRGYFPLSFSVAFGNARAGRS